MTQTYRTLRAAPSDEGVLSVVIDAPPMNLIGPELVCDFVTLLGELNSDESIRVMVLESADPEYFVPHVDLTKVAEYTAEAGPGDFIYIPPWVPHQEINASRDETLECVLCRSDGEAIAVNLDIEPVEKPETVRWIDPTHPQG